MGNLLLEVQEVFRDVFDREDLTLTRDTDASDVEGWDSLAHVNLVTVIEKRYKIKFALGELEDLKNVGDLLDLIQAKLDKKGNP